MSTALLGATVHRTACTLGQIGLIDERQHILGFEPPITRTSHNFRIGNQRPGRSNALAVAYQSEISSPALQYLLGATCLTHVGTEGLVQDYAVEAPIFSLNVMLLVFVEGVHGCSSGEILRRLFHSRLIQATRDIRGEARG